MQPEPATGLLTKTLRSLWSRVGHDLVWIAIAGLFCVVEGAVHVSEFAATKVFRSRSRSVAARREVAVSPGVPAPNLYGR